jgi:hypothetical protein
MIWPVIIIVGDSLSSINCTLKSQHWVPQYQLISDAIVLQGQSMVGRVRLPEPGCPYHAPNLCGSGNNPPTCCNQHTVGTTGDKRPETERPETERPETERPETERPETEGAETEGAETEGPETESAVTGAVRGGTVSLEKNDSLLVLLLGVIFFNAI